MHELQTPRSTDSRVVVGLVLVLVGGAVLVLRQMGTDVIATIEAAGWPFFVIIPGVILLGMSLIPAPPRGLGFAIAGSIVTTVGSILFVMERTGLWQSWAYAWALIPAGAGVGILLYGLATGARDLMSRGFRLIVTGTLIFAVGAWFFETVFATGEAPVDLGTWWPAIVIAIGLLVVIGGLTRRSANEWSAGGPSAPATGGGSR